MAPARNGSVVGRCGVSSTLAWEMLATVQTGSCQRSYFWLASNFLKFFAGEHARFSKEAAGLLLEAGIIKALPGMSKLADTRFIQ